MNRQIYVVISLVALALMILPSTLYFAGVIEHNVVTSAALVGTVVWFIATPVWMGRELPIDAGEVEI